jgi:hypothetical protein
LFALFSAQHFVLQGEGGAQPCEQLYPIDRRGYVINRTNRERSFKIIGFGPRSDHDDGNVA